MDYLRRIDVSTLDTNYTAAATCLFGDGITPHDAPNQDVINEGQGVATIVRVSFDGVNDHGILVPGGSAAGRSWFLHPRNRLWLKRDGAAGAGQMVQVGAWT